MTTAVLVGLMATAAAAYAQDLPVDPFATGEQQAKDNDLDTDTTPVAKKSDLWRLIHGTEFPKTEPVAGSATSFDTDFFALSFYNRALGLAGGSACTETPGRVAGESDGDYGERATHCEIEPGKPTPRVPALYRYTEPRSSDPVWERLELPGHDEPGYIGAITWIAFDRALIVGGTGTYPRRESEADGREPTDPDKADSAGRARAWLYEQGKVRELNLSDFTAGEPERAGMRGLTSVDCYEDPDPKPGEKELELCFAGGLAQIWEWRDGEFTGHRVDALSPATDLKSAQLFRHRVREIEFSGLEPAVAAAVTAGCCELGDGENVPRVLIFQESPEYDANNPGPEPPRWEVRTLFDPLGGGALATASGEAEDARRRPNTYPGLPDSFYSTSLAAPAQPAADGFGISVIASPGGPRSPHERPSTISSGHSANRIPRNEAVSNYMKPVEEAGRTAATTARLLSGSGRPESNSRWAQPRWAVGELRSTAVEGLGTRGLVVDHEQKPPVQDAINAGVGGNPILRPTPEELASGWEPVDEDRLERWRRSQHYLLPSYTANAVEIVGDGAAGWAVGDRGAILALATDDLRDAGLASEPRPPRLGAARREPLSDRDPFAGRRPSLPRAADVVPGLGIDHVRLDEPAMIPAGAPGGAVGEIIVSRDGSEGWALGGDASSGARFHRFDGVTWTECDPLGIDRLVAADPACEEMAPLRGYINPQGDLARVAIDAAARVPLESDSDPTNDNELEILALAGFYTGPETGGQTVRALLRYRDGRWRFESPAATAEIDIDLHVADLAFTAPDEGWLLGRTGAGTGIAYLYRYDGETWTDCATAADRCGDEQGRLPRLGDEVSGLAAANERIYLYGRRIADNPLAGGAFATTRSAPLILYRDRGGHWTDGSQAGEDGGGLDPAFEDPASAEAGWVQQLVVTKGPDGYEGWAIGPFGGTAGSKAAGVSPGIPPEAVLLRLEPGRQDWRRFHSPGAYEDYMKPRIAGGQETGTLNGLQVTYPSALDPDATFIAQNRSPSHGSDARVFGFDARRGRFELLDSGRPQGASNLAIGGEAHPSGKANAMAADGRGGFWIAVSGYFFHWTDEAPRSAFEDAPDPLGIRSSRVRDLAAGPDGSVWAATDSNRLYRYERGLGWEAARVAGWDPGRVVTRSSSANSVAIGPDGDGVAVGEGGRIANLSPDEVALDRAAGRSCALGDPVPCGTSRDLVAADIAPDGAALAAGERLSLLWRPPGGAFRSVTPPRAPSSATIEAVSYPSPNSAYLVTDRGAVFRGELVGEQWTWHPEAEDERGDPISIDSRGDGIPLRDVAIDASGHGYAVGDAGLVLERSAAGGWRRLPAHHAYDLTSVELPTPGGEGVLVGGESGLILTGHGSKLRVARAPDYGKNVLAGPVVGFAYLPGSVEGSVDAWAAIGPTSGSTTGDSRLLRYRSDSGDRLLEPAAASRPLADAPAGAGGELSIAAFGKSDCDHAESTLCPEMSATTTTNEVVARRITAELGDLRERGRVDLAVMSGDAADSAGLPGNSLADPDRTNGVGPPLNVSRTQVTGQLKHRRYAELVADRLEDEGVPLMGALGGQDLSEAFYCNPEGHCDSSKSVRNAGENYAWREAFAGRAEPWGNGEDMVEPAAGAGEGGEEVELVAVRGSDDASVRVEDQNADADGEGPAPAAKAEVGGASTHYAVEAVRGGERIARLVFVDTSQGSLAASDPLQQPQEPAGGQTRWLERMICTEGQTTPTGDECTRGEDQAAIVVSNTPTYSYGPGALTNTATDAAAFEALMLRYDVDLVISGALGYNGLYWTLAPGIHEPCPGGEHPEKPPQELPSCAGGADSDLSPLDQQGVPDPQKLLEEQGLTGAVPTLIASGAGGKFGPDGQQSADGPAGQWHGYSIARLRRDGEVIVEQRPILDWIGIDAPDHTLTARSRLRLRGYGRSPISTGVSQPAARAFHYEIASPAITHRYDLVLADPDRPWLACPASDASCRDLHARLGSSVSGSSVSGSSEACDPYLCLPEKVGTVDRQTGEVKAGDGKHPETFAIAMLSVADKVATYPLVFKPSPSFVVTPFEGPPQLPANAQPAAPPPPSLPKPQIPSLTLPTPPTLPAIPPLVAATPPEPAPPAPPAPPPPTEQPSPLNLSVAPTGLTVATPTAVIQPPTPPVNPAPPGGARREARQRQAAAQKSGADSAQEQQDGASDLADGPPSASGSQQMSRHEARRRERSRAGASFTPLTSREQPSSWASGALYGGGLALTAFALAAGWSRGRPTPRRRAPDVAAPALSRARRRV